MVGSEDEKARPPTVDSLTDGTCRRLVHVERRQQRRTDPFCCVLRSRDSHYCYWMGRTTAPSRGGFRPLSNTWFVGPNWFSLPNGFSIVQSFVLGASVRPTNTQTHGPRYVRHQWAKVQRLVGTKKGILHQGV